MTACREAALKIKTASGIQRFQEDKNFGTWFNKLFAVVKSMDSCQPEQSLEPNCAQAGVPSGSETTPPSSNETDNCPGNNKKRKLFVPIHETTKKAKTWREENITQGLCDINNALSNDPTEKILDFLKEESDRQQQRDNRFMALLERMVTMPVQQPIVQQPVHQAYTPWNFMNSPPPHPQQHHSHARYGMSYHRLNMDKEGPVYENL
ncbi:uncharacterized protein LOC130625365 [Hydractinia symbiolongicarpus]|uniref:uncharacterized protein LOC130625365 n=1 Tax=Hydractinia symbiolongicarpus TaxID=13093 RepID=UPI00254C4C1C|nr:uncharacterized protein LOC130625365 [Hydractinia symbiolongicarpus]